MIWGWKLLNLVTSSLQTDKKQKEAKYKFVQPLDIYLVASRSQPILLRTYSPPGGEGHIGMIIAQYKQV